MSATPLSKRISALRNPLAGVMVVVVAGHHLLVRALPSSWHLASEILVYGLGGTLGVWLLLGWLARSVAVAERSGLDLAESARRLKRRNQQMEAVYSASHLLAGARSLEDVAQPLLELALRIADARAGVLVLFAPDAESPQIVSLGDAARAADCRGGIDGALCPGCPEAPGCGLPAEARCIPIPSGQEVAGLVRLSGADWDADTQQSLNTLVSEIAAVWLALRTEGRAMQAIATAGDSVRAHGDPDAALRRFIEQMCQALGATGGAIYRLAGDGPAVESAWGAHTAAPVKPPPPDPSNRIWAEGGRRVFAAFGEDVIMGLTFATRRPLRDRDIGLLRVVGSQAGFLLELKEMLPRLIWRERRRLAGEIHDDLAQTLAYLHLQSRQVKDLRDNGKPEKADAVLAEMSATALSAYERVRDTIDDLRLRPRLGEPVDVFLRRVATAAAADGVEIETIVPTDLRLSADVLAQLVRLMQEALNNACRHGRAGQILVEFRRDPPFMALVIRDNGVGFDMRAGVPTGHHGIAMMRERIEGLGGRLEVDSAPGTGTVVHATWTDDLATAVPQGEA